MADPYWRYGAVPTDRVSAQKTNFPGILSSEASALTTSQPWNSNGSRGTSDFLPRDIMPLGHGSYGGDGIANIRPGSGVDGLGTSAGIQRYPSPIHDRSLLPQRHEAAPGRSPGNYPGSSVVDRLGTSASIHRYPSPIQDRSLSSQRYDAAPGRSSRIYPGSNVDGVVTSAGIQRYPSPTQDPSLLSQRHDAAPGRSPRIPDIPQMHSSFKGTDGPLATAGESNVLFVDGLPTDCSRREVGHLFRPFIGFKEIKVVHKEARHKGDKAMVLCFVEFADSKCALTAMEALQGYKFDDKKPEAPILQICFAHFPFRLPAHNENRLGPIP